VSIWVSTFPGS